MREIPLTRGLVAIVDDADFEIVAARKWHAHTFGSGRRDKFYAASIANRRTTYLHVFLLGRVDGLVIDHINGDPLDNRRENLRYATVQQNAVSSRARPNQSGYRGVLLCRGRWQAYMRNNRRQIHIGTFSTAVEAARARDSEVRRVFGEFAALNFPDAAEVA